MTRPWWTLLVMAVALLTPACGLLEPEHPTITVVKGDTLSKLARAHGVTVAELKAWNGLTSDTIEIGQVLVLKVDAAAAEPAAAAPAAQRPRRRAKGATVRAADAPTTTPATFTMPAPKPCLAGPTDVEGDEGMVASAGLDLDAVRGSMNTFIQHTARCLPEGGVDGVITLDFVVGCDGRVSALTVADDGGLPSELGACVVDTLRHAPFPAHDLPDGFPFTFPLRFSTE